MSLWKIFLGALIGYVILIQLKKVYKILSELYVIWSVAFRGQNSNGSGGKLYANVCETKLLDEFSVDQIFTFFNTMLYSEATIQQFQQDLLSYKYIILCREQKDGSLRGGLFLDIRDGEHKGEKHILCRLGLAYIHRQYQGSGLLYGIGGYLILKEILLHPFTPVYMVGKAFSHKSYMMGARVMKGFYPRYDAETPELEKALIDKYAELVKLPGDVYRSDTGVIERELTRVEDFVVSITNKDLENPHIKFFNDRNPGWRKGHLLIAIGRVTLPDLYNMVLYILKRMKGRKRRAKSKTRERLLSFQNEQAQAYARQHSTELRAIHQASTDRLISEESERTDDQEVLNRPRRGSMFEVNLC